MFVQRTTKSVRCQVTIIAPILNYLINFLAELIIIWIVPAYNFFGNWILGKGSKILLKIKFFSLLLLYYKPL